MAGSAALAAFARLEENGDDSRNRSWDAGATCSKSAVLGDIDIECQSHNIKVYVRTRPLSKDEANRGDNSCIQVNYDEKSLKVVEQGYGYNVTTRSFKFDGCMGSEVHQRDVLKKVHMKKLLDKVLAGYSSTVMACGQTGSGKTFTMCGQEENLLCDMEGGDNGLIVRSATYLFEAMKACEHNTPNGQKPFTMRASYFEIYTEQVNDLLRLDNAPRDVKWSSRDGYYVDNLLLVDCDTLSDVISVLNEGSRNRKVGSHELNKDSSRSHCIMTLHVDSLCQVGDDAPPITRYGRMLFVDLAGSERLKKSKSSGEMLKETGSINRSLFTLGKVISALSEGKKGDVVPYRESLLTKLLMDSLGGKSLALMIACISPASSAIDETLSTLHYATCANNIVNAPAVNLDARDKIVLKLQKEIAHLKEENQYLRSKLGEKNIQVQQFLSLDNVATPPLSMAKRVRHSSQRSKSRENLPSELKGMEKYFSKESRGSNKDFTKELQGFSVFGNFQNDSDSSISDSSRCSLIPSESNRRNQAGSNGWDYDKPVDSNGTSNVQNEPQCLKTSNESNSLLGMYRGLAKSNSKGLQYRRNRVSVDHLGGSRIRLRRGGGKNGKQEPRFQGSITVNQTTFLKRLLDLNLSPVQ
nr:kinesin-like protein klp-20 isoform X2 [Physcomitrium patens]|eukprot:XP_024401166.1 kinesin-like protein klp-20 isoform X2 [Physcomitrella patens]